MRQTGFTLLEAIVALVVLSMVSLALYAWINTNLMNLQRVEQARERAVALRAALDYVAGLNPLETPEGEAKLGEYRLRWSSRVVQTPRDGVSSLGGFGLYQVGLYEVRAQLSGPRGDLGEFQVRQPGFRQAREPETGG